MSCLCKLSVVVAASLLFLPGTLGQEAALPTPAAAWQMLKDGNARFAADKPETKDLGTKRRTTIAKGQHPFAIVLTCADSRVGPEHVFNQGLGDLFVVRVAGNVSDPFILGSMEYAVEHLHVPLIVVLGHEKCGAVDAALSKEKLPGNLGKLIAEIHVGDILAADRTKAVGEGVRNNVVRQAELLSKRSEVIKEHVEQKKLRIVAGVYQLGSGKVEWVEGK